MIQFSRVKSHSDLVKIKALQNENLRSLISETEASDQGFLTAEYSLSFLEKMNNACPSVIAKENDSLIGYCLAAVQSIRGDHELLEDLFAKIDETLYKEQVLKYSNYVVVGQLCVKRNFRGRNIAQGLYSHFKTSLSPDFEYCITDIQQTNKRSIHTHLKAGFEIIGSLTFNSEPWVMVLWDWKSL